MSIINVWRNRHITSYVFYWGKQIWPSSLDIIFDYQCVTGTTNSAINTIQCYVLSMMIQKCLPIFFTTSSLSCQNSKICRKHSHKQFYTSLLLNYSKNISKPQSHYLILLLCILHGYIQLSVIIEHENQKSGSLQKSQGIILFGHEISQQKPTTQVILY